MNSDGDTNSLTSANVDMDTMVDVNYHHANDESEVKSEYTKDAAVDMDNNHHAVDESEFKLDNTKQIEQDVSSSSRCNNDGNQIYLHIYHRVRAAKLSPIFLSFISVIYHSRHLYGASIWGEKYLCVQEKLLLQFQHY